MTDRQAAAEEVVLVTGGSSGIGEGLASRFHARGAQVIITGRNGERLQAVADQHPGMRAIVMDVADRTPSPRPRTMSPAWCRT